MSINDSTGKELSGNFWSDGLASRATALIAVILLVVVGVTMMLSDVRMRQADPLRSARLKDYKAQLRLTPADEKLKKDIRQYDLELRARYFGHLSRKESGVYILLGAAALLVLASSKPSRAQVAMPQPKPDALAQANKLARFSRWSVAGTGAVIGGGFLVLGLTLNSALQARVTRSEKLPGTEPGQSSVPDLASIQELRQNWPQFRGFDGGGVAAFTNLPVTWDSRTGAGIAWKIATPLGGCSSPIVWGERIFFSGANENERAVYCLDANTGQVLWHENVSGLTNGNPEGAAVSRAAHATMATDGRRVYAFFDNGELAAFALNGKPEWSKGFGPLKNDYGHAASLVLAGEKLILQLDQGESQDGKSKLYALDGRDGRILWQRPRRTGSSWATPIVIEPEGSRQIITLAVPALIAYGVADGNELWRVEGFSGEITPSPIFAAGLVFAVSPSQTLFAIRPMGPGNTMKSNIVWTTDENVPDITSPVCDGERIYTLTTSGVLSCWSVREGKKQWEHDFEAEFNSSPSAVAGRVYLFGTKGTAIVVEGGQRFKELFRTEMGDVFKASPAFAEQRIFLRGETNIWCLGPKAEKLARKE